MEEGYFLAKNVFKKDRIIKIQEDIWSIFNNYSKSHDLPINLFDLFKEDLEGFKSCAHASQKLISLYGLAIDEKILDIIENKCGIKKIAFNTKPCLAFSHFKTSVNDSYWKIPAHQDWHSNLGSDNGVTCWNPLVNLTEQMGFLEVVPNSHKKGLQKSFDFHAVPVLIEQNWQFKSIPMDMGDVLIFHNLTIHKSGNNLSDKIRLTAHFRYNDLSDASYIKRGYSKNRTNE